MAVEMRPLTVIMTSGTEGGEGRGAGGRGWWEDEGKSGLMVGRDMIPTFQRFEIGLWDLIAFGKGGEGGEVGMRGMCIY